MLPPSKRNNRKNDFYPQFYYNFKNKKRHESKITNQMAAAALIAEL